MLVEKTLDDIGQKITLTKVNKKNPSQHHPENNIERRRLKNIISQRRPTKKNYQSSLAKKLKPMSAKE